MISIDQTLQREVESLAEEMLTSCQSRPPLVLALASLGNALSILRASGMSASAVMTIVANALEDIGDA